MISFKQFLNEAQNYPLYHGTIGASLAEIVRTNTIKTGFIERDAHWPSKTGGIISTTRSFNFAKDWSLENTGIGSYYVIQLDRSKIRHNYKVVPFNYFGSELTDKEPKARWKYGKSNYAGVDRNQFEEAITKDIKPALKYIVSVIMNPEGEKNFKKAYGDEYSLLVQRGLLKIK